jgi:hypothetical protein
MSLLLAAGSAPATISFSSATTDGTDVFASNISVLISASSAVADGADVLAGQVSVTVGFTSSTTDGADAANGQVSVTVELSSGTTDGSDVMVGLVTPASTPVSFSSAITDGADHLESAIRSGDGDASGGWKKEAPKKKINLSKESQDRKKAVVDAYQVLLEPHTTEAIAEEAKQVIQSAPLDLIEQDLQKVKELLALWQSELDAREQDDEEALLMLL